MTSTVRRVLTTVLGDPIFNHEKLLQRLSPSDISIKGILSCHHNNNVLESKHNETEAHFSV